jgi:tetratricopeptide (TPR) repeat protein
VKDVARDLGSQYVLEGSVRKSGDRVRITAQLIDAIADKHVWAEKYDRELKDVFQVQDEITQSIVTSVAPEFLSAELRRAQRKEEPNLDAWDAFMRGYWHHMRFTKDDNAIAQGLLRKAIDLDSRQANYHALLAVTHLIAGLYGWSESKDASYREALEIAERGLALDDQDSQVIRSAGLVHFFSKNHEVALGYYERAVAANPYEAENRALLGAALGVAGDYEAALEQFEMALRLSPRDVHVATWYNYMGIAAFVAGRHEEAADWAKKTADANPQFPAGHRTLAASYGNLGRLAEAEAARERLQELLPHLTIAQLRESLPYFKNSDDLERYLDGLRKAGLPE